MGLTGSRQADHGASPLLLVRGLAPFRSVAGRCSWRRSSTAGVSSISIRRPGCAPECPVFSVPPRGSFLDRLFQRHEFGLTFAAEMEFGDVRRWLTHMYDSSACEKFPTPDRKIRATRERSARSPRSFAFPASLGKDCVFLLSPLPRRPLRRYGFRELYLAWRAIGVGANVSN